MFFRIKSAGNRRYLQIVENRRDGRATRQSVVATLGSLEGLQQSGGLDALLRSGARLCGTAMLLSPRREGPLDGLRIRRVGSPLVFDRLWQETGCRPAIEELLGAHRSRFAIERAIFATVLHRLLAPGSQRACERWLEDYRVDGIEAPTPQLLYRAMAWLGEGRPAAAAARRRNKDRVEEALFGQTPPPTADAGMALLHATCLPLPEIGADRAAPQGGKAEAGPRQVVAIVALDRDGRPLCCETAPGSAVELSLLLPLQERLRVRFGVARLCLVAERGSIAGGLLPGLESHGIEYIIGGYQRSDSEIREIVLRDAAPRRRRRTLEIREATVGDPGEAGQRRYVICRSGPQAGRDAAARAAQLAGLEQRLRQGEREFAGNPGYRRFLAAARDGRLAIDPARVAADARFDGLSVFRAGTTLAAEAIAAAYRRSARVGSSLRTAKAILDARTIFRHSEGAVIGHLFCSFLALLLRHALEERLAARGLQLDWGDVARDLDRVQEAEARQGAKRVVLAAEAPGCAPGVFEAAGVAWPPMAAASAAAATPPAARRRARRSRPAAAARP